MDEQEPNLISTLTDAVSGIPEAVRKPFIAACSELFGGLVAIPAAKLQQCAQSIRDTTAARSLASQKIAAIVAENHSVDPEILAIAAEAYLPVNLRKIKNKLGVVQAAVQHLPAATENNDVGDAAVPNDDWLNNFMRFAEDASSERLQDLFGRILAGQVTRPGAFGLSTIRTLSELDQEIAEDFILAWSLSLGQAVDYADIWQRGEWYSRWMRLTEAGLMASANTAQYPPDFIPDAHDMVVWCPIRVAGTWLLAECIKDSSASWVHIQFTRIGKEIGSILERPNYEKNIRTMAHRLRQPGINRIIFCKEGLPPEVLWTK